MPALDSLLQTVPYVLYELVFYSVCLAALLTGLRFGRDPAEDERGGYLALLGVALLVPTLLYTQVGEPLTGDLVTKALSGAAAPRILLALFAAFTSKAAALFCGTPSLTLLSISSVSSLLLLWGSQLGSWYIFIVVAAIAAQVALWEKWTGQEVFGSQLLGFSGSAVIFCHVAVRVAKTGGLKSLAKMCGPVLYPQLGKVPKLDGTEAMLASCLAGAATLLSVCILRWLRRAPLYEAGARPWGVFPYFGSLAVLSFCYTTASTTLVLLGTITGALVVGLSDMTRRDGEQLHQASILLLYLLGLALAHWGRFLSISGLSTLNIIAFLLTTSYSTWMYGRLARRQPSWFIKGTSSPT
eukprot:gene23915-29018_t